MKVKVELLFDSEAEASAYLANKAIHGKLKEPVSQETAQLNREHAQMTTPKQEYEATQQPVTAGLSPIEKARATKAANKAKKDAEAAFAASAKSTVPTTAFPTQPSQPLSPMPQMPAAPQGMPMPSGMPQMAQQPAVNYGAPMHQPAPQVQAPAPVAPPVQQQAQAWDRNAVISDIQSRASTSGMVKEQIQQMFMGIFQELQVQAVPVGQLDDQNLYRFLMAFNQKMQGNPNHLA